MHEFVGLVPSMTQALLGLCQGEASTREHLGNNPTEEAWTDANG
jgi:hypothetical protein